MKLNELKPELLFLIESFILGFCVLPTHWIRPGHK